MPMTNPAYVLVGLTGPLASGKSTAARHLVETFGFIHIDADSLGHEVYEPGTRGFDEVVAHFGASRILCAKTGCINRAALGSIVFNDKLQLQKLQNIVWPELWKLVIRRIDERLTKIPQGTEPPVFLLDGAVLVETKWYEAMDAVIVLEALNATTLVQRAVQRSNNQMTEAQAKSRLESQLSRAARREILETKFDGPRFFVDVECDEAEFRDRIVELGREIMTIRM